MLPHSQFQKENQSCIMKGENQTVLFEFIILGFSNLNELKFDAQINENGSMDVTETWDIYISHTNTLFKTFELYLRT